jgi:response regulator RpfG family c-di-GMP phosphodiesterase
MLCEVSADTLIGTMERMKLKQVLRPFRNSFWKGAVAVRSEELHQSETDDGPSTEASMPFGAESPVDETEGILFALARAVEQRDQCTWGHCERLALISVTIGVAMRLDRPDIITLYRGGYLHDIGKVGIPDSILFKQGKLTASEWVVMRTHSARGEEICRHMKSLEPVLPIIRHHHERWDGTGYPDGLRGDQIPLLARMVQIADIYDALTSRRTYKEPFTEAEALQTLQHEAQLGWRDPHLTALFVRLHDEVISRIAGFSQTSNANSDPQRSSLMSLNQFLAWQA